MQLPARVDKLMRDKIFSLVIELAFWNDGAPLQVTFPVKGQHHNILSMEAGGIGAIVPAPGLL